ncbi:serine hydrolase domain-containing protein [Schumannella soli]|uniref:Beta-lactamase family protein n=1 Tax=Schumannella soli TaxID=2590779 RepID=A0A506Y097_9MICO|nr:serine hydrolase domain-containing protein [Schumannella soli]TPW75412.1 beta-lactamase family protein [Schumannella soli]
MSGAGAAAAPSTSTDPTAGRLPRAHPAALGVDPAAIERLTASLTRIGGVHSLMVVRRGQVVGEGWWAPYRAELPHTLNSVSKSVTALAVGVAIDEGLLGLDDRVIDLLPEDAPAQPSERLQRLTVRHLLTMSRGCSEPDFDGVRSRQTAEAVCFVLNEPLDHEPGERFVYSTGTTFLVAAILQRLTGGRLLDFVADRLFGPLGITTRDWDSSADGVDLGGSGLHLRTEELALLGQLLLQRGAWGGRQLVPADWLDLATSPQIATTDVAPFAGGAPGPGDWELGYGFQFWRSRHGAYRADGAFGQFIVVLPELETVVVTTAGLDPMDAVLDAIWTDLLPGIGALPDADAAPAAAALPETETAPDAGSDEPARLSGLRLPPQPGTSTSSRAHDLLGRRFAIDDGAHLIGLRIDIAVPADRVVDAAADADDDRAEWTLELETAHGVERLGAGHGRWVEGTTSVITGSPTPVGVSAGWDEAAEDDATADGARADGARGDGAVWRLRIQLIETAQTLTVAVTVDDDTVRIEGRMHGWFAPAELGPITGHATRRRGDESATPRSAG